MPNKAKNMRCTECREDLNWKKDTRNGNNKDNCYCDESVRNNKQTYFWNKIKNNKCQ